MTGAHAVPEPADVDEELDELAAPIEAERLSLVLVPPEVLLAVAESGLGADGAEVVWPGVGPVAVELASTMPASMRIRQVEGDPGQAPWLIRGIVVPDADSSTGVRLAGHLGGHGAPDERGMVEAGYTVAEADRGRGLATEGVRAWFAWAHRHGATTAQLSVEPTNEQSLAIAQRLGLVEIGRVWDEDDQVWEIVHAGPLPLA